MEKFKRNLRRKSQIILEKCWGNCKKLVTFEKLLEIWEEITQKFEKNSAVCVRTRTVNVNTFSTTVKDEISEGW